MQRNRIKISVIVPVYNAELYIERCIQALLAQNYPEHHFEILMIDNNSNDQSGEIIKRYPRVEYLKEEKQGSYAARNQGITEAKGAILAFTDADCMPAINWLHNIEAVMCHPEVHVVLGNNQFATDSQILSMLASYEAEKAAYVFSSNKKQIYYGYTNNMATRTNLFSRLGLFQEMHRGADVIFVRRIVDKYSCDAVCHSPDICVRHMEVASQRDYFRKQYIYGKSYKTYHKIKSARVLSTVERLKILKATCQRNRYSLTKSCLLLFILLIGVIYYERGRTGI